jgi:16S rRNA (guanine527-N7)-methyltransferase
VIASAMVIADGAREIGVAFPPEQADSLARFAQLLERWSDRFNLISRSDRSRLVPRHLLDSLSLLPLLTGSSILDVGSGAGLPGLPLAITAPERRFVLLDRSERKLRFARQAAIELGLVNVEFAVAPVETYAPGEAFATIVARAVKEPCALWRTAARLLSAGGRMLVLRGSPDRAPMPREVDAETRRVDIPGLDAPHWILVLSRRAEAERS